MSRLLLPPRSSVQKLEKSHCNRFLCLNEEIHEDIARRNNSSGVGCSVHAVYSVNPVMLRSAELSLMPAVRSYLG